VGGVVTAQEQSGGGHAVMGTHRESTQVTKKHSIQGGGVTKSGSRIKSELDFAGEEMLTRRSSKKTNGQTARDREVR